MFSLSRRPSSANFSSSTSPSVPISSFLLTFSLMLVWTLLNEVLAIFRKLIPQQLHDRIVSTVKSLIGLYYSYITLTIDEYINGVLFDEMFEDLEIYLHRKIISPSVERLKISGGSGQKDICISIEQGEKILDTFQGIDVSWKMVCTQIGTKSSDDEIVERRSLELKFHKKYREMVLTTYLPDVLKRSKAMKEENKVVKLYSFCGGWSSVNLDHPSTFETLALDPTLKKEIKDDLDRFVNRREFYRRVGKAWKRGYLLYGPPGTGKSSLIAAIANYLNFHIYDLELTRLFSNSDLRRVVLSTANQSILVIKDLDCSRKSQNREDGGHSQLVQSGLLDFIDGLWSSCGDQKIIIFTTNHKDRLDPALLRPGRMDMHIHMSYCTPCGFKTLASNYLSINNHSTFTEIEKLVTEVEVTPAEIAEELMKSDKADIALEGVIKFLHMKKTEHDKANAEGEKEVNEQVKESSGNKEGAEYKARKNKRKAKRDRSRG